MLMMMMKTLVVGQMPVVGNHLVDCVDWYTSWVDCYIWYSSHLAQFLL